MKSLNVYLSGGFHTDWQDRVMSECVDLPINFLNPLAKEKGKDGKWEHIHKTEEQREEESKKETQVPWCPMDKLAIEKADVIACYHEDYRPKLLGTGTIFELGMAYALGKMVILCNCVDHRYYRQFELIFTRAADLEDLIAQLRKASWLAS